MEQDPQLPDPSDEARQMDMDPQLGEATSRPITQSPRPQQEREPDFLAALREITAYTLTALFHI